MSPTGSGSATERAYTHVRAGILDQTFPAGDLLTEGDLADQVGVSRTPVREALLRLEAEGLVRLYPKRGALVVPVTPREAEEILEARCLVEQWAAPRAVRSGGEALRERLTALVGQMRAAVAAGDPAAVAAADRAFHEAVVESAGNSILHRLYVSLRDRQLCLSAASMSGDPDRARAALADHEGLLEALVAGDADLFAERTAAHLATVSAADRDAS